MIILLLEAHAINATMSEMLIVSYFSIIINNIIMTDIAIMFYYIYLNYLYFIKLFLIITNYTKLP